MHKGILAPYTWAADGRLVISLPKDLSGGGARDIVALPLDGKGSPQPILAEPFHEQRPAISPNGRWLAYGSGESGRNEIYLRPFPNVDSGKWKVSADGGLMSLWSPDGKELFYLTKDSLMAVAVDENGPSTSSQALFGLSGFLEVGAFRYYSVGPDGKRFLFLRDVADTAGRTQSADLVVVLNWFEELKSRVATK